MKAAILAILLCGCSTIVTVPTLPDKPVSLMTPCGTPTKLQKGATWRDVLQSHASDVQTMMDCKADHDGLSEWVDNLYKAHK